VGYMKEKTVKSKAKGGCFEKEKNGGGGGAGGDVKGGRKIT